MSEPSKPLPQLLLVIAQDNDNLAKDGLDIRGRERRHCLTMQSLCLEDPSSLGIVVELFGSWHSSVAVFEHNSPVLPWLKGLQW